MAIQPLLPAWVNPVVTFLAVSGFVIAMITFMTEALSQFHPIRIWAYAISGLAFVVALIIADNPGNVVLEITLALIMLRSAFIARDVEHSVGGQKEWRFAIVGGAIALVGALVIAYYWPVGPETEWAGSHWPNLSYSGAVIIVIMVINIESGRLEPTSWVVPVLQMSGSSLIAISNLGDYNLTSIILNSILVLFSIIKLGKILLEPKKKAAQAA